MWLFKKRERKIEDSTLEQEEFVKQKDEFSVGLEEAIYTPLQGSMNKSMVEQRLGEIIRNIEDQKKALSNIKEQKMLETEPPSPREIKRSKKILESMIES